MSDRLYKFLADRGEYYAMGWWEMRDAPPVCRMGRALRRHLERCDLAPHIGEPLYPAGRYSLWDQGAAARFHYSFPFNFDALRWEGHVQGCAAPDLREQLSCMGQALASYPLFTEITPPEFRLGGNGYTHSIIHYERVIAEGLDRYVERVEAQTVAAANEKGEKLVLYRALGDVLAGIRAYHTRLVAHLETELSSSSDAHVRLLNALRRVPWQPARNFYEGLVAVNFLYYLDGCDNLGRFDQVLGDLYEADLEAGRITEAEGERLARLLWENVNDNDGWNTALGGTTTDGGPAYNRLTVTCLRAAWDIRRPNLTLRVRADMPQEVWDAALDAIASGCGLPALYNEGAYLDALSDTALVAERDLADYAFGGCTETMIHGKSNVGSLDAGINLPRILTESLARMLPSAPTFEALLDGYKVDVSQTIARLTEAVCQQQERKARYHPQLIRTLLIEDCIDRGIEYNAGGARYNWSVINVGGIGNVVDALVAVREVVYERGEISGQLLWDALAANYKGYGWLRERLDRCPHYGNDDPAADDLAAELSSYVFAEFARHTPWRGGRFFPACLMFVTYANAGQGVMATPDGRLADAPIADSAGPVAGRDRRGPTAMVRSVSKIDMQRAPGTLVVNMRLDKKMLEGAEDRAKTQALLRTYFALGNMQVQINVIDQETLKAAIVDPESYRDLVVRVAGYSEYWSRLAPELRQTVLERTIHTL
jgi:formate C-acetyltransferase